MRSTSTTLKSITGGRADNAARQRRAAGVVPRSRSTSGRRPDSVRLTARGRAVLLTLLVVIALVGVATAAATTVASTDRAPARPAATVLVDADDTLWSIAVEHDPHRDPYATVADIQRLNQLSGTHIRPGQLLVLPPATR